MKTFILELLAGVVDVFKKTSKSGDKEQEIKEKKINVYSKVLTIVLLVTLAMCVVASLFPHLAISSWWFDLLEKLINEVQ